MKIIGIIPARMKASRFPGKPLYPIIGLPMVEHVIRRAQLFKGWDALALATCDQEILDFSQKIGCQCVMTSAAHNRCLDRVNEAVPLVVSDAKEDDIIVCVQGDEPMLHPKMIENVIAPLLDDSSVNATVLAMDIVSQEEFENKNVVKIVHNLKGDVVYTSRAPVPFNSLGNPLLGAKRIYGIFAFRFKHLKLFSSLPESPLERLESCDSNRFFDNSLKQRIAHYPYIKSFAVDSPEDIYKVEAAIIDDPILKLYT